MRVGQSQLSRIRFNLKRTVSFWLRFCVNPLHPVLPLPLRNCRTPKHLRVFVSFLRVSAIGS